MTPELPEASSRSDSTPTANDPTITRIRIDVWLDVTCLFKTRSEAQRACRGGKVDVDGQRAKPHRSVQRGDRLTISRAQARKQIVIVEGLASQHLPKAVAKTLYDDVTPPLTEAEREAYRLGATSGAWPPARGPKTQSPDARQRREIRRLKRGS